MKKNKLFFLSIIIAIVSIFILSSCGNENKDPVVNEFILGDGNTSGNVLTYEYYYGEELTFVSDLRAYLKYDNGNVVELTEEQYQNVIIEYYLANGEKKSELSNRTTFDVGYYGITVKYESYLASINLTIKSIDVSSKEYSFVIKKKNRIEYNVSYGSSSIENNLLVSDYTLTLQQNSKAIEKKYITQVSYLTEDEYNHYRGLLSDELKEEYLAQQLEDYRLITYNSDGPSDKEFYVNTRGALVPGNTYYLYAKINLDNYNEFITTPNNNSKFNVVKGKLSILDSLVYEGNQYTNEQIKEKITFSATYTYKDHIGDIKLSDVSDILINYSDLDAEKLSLFDGESGFGVGSLEFEYVSPNTQLNCNRTYPYQARAKIKFDDLSQYYDFTDIVNIDVTLVKGKVVRPSIFVGENVYSAFESPYTGSEIVFAGNAQNGAILTYEDHYLKPKNLSVLKATNVGNYHVEFELIDNVNYEFDDTIVEGFYYGDNGKFDWSIVKANPTTLVTPNTYYNNENTYGTIVYDRSNHTFELKFDENSNYTYLNSREFNLEILDMYNCNITYQKGDDNYTFIITFEFDINAENDLYYFNYKLTSDADTNYNKYEYESTINICQSSLSQEERNILLATCNYRVENDTYMIDPDVNVYVITQTVFENGNSKEVKHYYLKQSEIEYRNVYDTLGEWKVIIRYYPDDTLANVNVSFSNGVYEILYENCDDLNHAIMFRSSLSLVFETPLGVENIELISPLETFVDVTSLN